MHRVHRVTVEDACYVSLQSPASTGGWWDRRHEELLHLLHERPRERLHLHSLRDDDLVEIQLHHDHSIDRRHALVCVVHLGGDAHQIGSGCLQILYQLRGEQRDERVHPLKGIEKRDKRLGTERERVHLRGDQKHSLLLKKCCDHLHDVARREGVQQRLEAQFVSEREALGRREDDLDELVEDDHLLVNPRIDRHIQLERGVQRRAEVHKIPNLTLHRTLHDERVIRDVAGGTLAKHRAERRFANAACVIVANSILGNNNSVTIELARCEREGEKQPKKHSECRKHWLMGQQT